MILTYVFLIVLIHIGALHVKAQEVFVYVILKLTIIVQTETTSVTIIWLQVTIENVTLIAPRFGTTEFQFGFDLLDAEGNLIRSETIKPGEGEEADGALGGSYEIPELESTHSVNVNLWFSVGDSRGNRTVPLPPSNADEDLRVEVTAYDRERHPTALSEWSLYLHWRTFPLWSVLSGETE
jgi:hypothetical protein